jgi:hypothetical protein
MTNKEQIDIANEEYVNGLPISLPNFGKIHRIQNILETLEGGELMLVKGMIAGWFDSKTVKE